jgi:protein SCO1/2
MTNIKRSIGKIPKVIFFLLSIVLSIDGQIILEDAAELKKIDVLENLGATIPLNLHFTDDNNNTILLADYFNKDKPILLTLAYYECPMLCNLVFNGLTKAIADLPYVAGKDFQMVTISIDPKETVELAAAKKENYLQVNSKSVLENGWAFLVGEEQNSKKLAQTLGFKYYYDEDRDEYAHPAVIFILTADGVISRYLYGIEYKQKDLRFAILEASQGKIGNTLDKLLLYCYHYDPDAKGYVLFAGNVMRFGGVVTMLTLGGILGFFWRKEVRKKKG